MQLTLLIRSYCHLCDEMLDELRPLIGTTPLAVLDVDDPDHAGLEARFGDAVPVLFAGPPGGRQRALPLPPGRGARSRRHSPRTAESAKIQRFDVIEGARFRVPPRA